MHEARRWPVLMRRALRLLPMPLLFACTSRERAAGTPDTTVAQTTRADTALVTLRAELHARLVADQAAREQLTARLQRGLALDPATVRAMQAVDSANTQWLRGVVARSGWPSRAQVGDSGALAAFLIVQHADADTAFQAWALPHLEAAHQAGDVAGQDVALLTDRLAVARGQPQLYGTQTDFRDGRIVVKPMVQPEQVDARRARMGLPPMAVYLRVLDSVYLGGRGR